MLTNLVNYDYYTDTFEGPSIPEPSFNQMAIKASSYVNRYTFNRINKTNINDNVRNCVCEIVELLYSQKTKREKIEKEQIVASETVGSHTKTYVNNINIIEENILSEDELDIKCYKICYKYLIHSGLMYRGF